MSYASRYKRKKSAPVGLIVALVVVAAGIGGAAVYVAQRPNAVAQPAPQTPQPVVIQPPREIVPVHRPLPAPKKMEVAAESQIDFAAQHAQVLEDEQRRRQQALEAAEINRQRDIAAKKKAAQDERNRRFMQDGTPAVPRFK